MMKKLLASAAIASALSFGLTAPAIADDSVNLLEDCGLGAMIFKDSPTAAIVSNVIWDLGTTATTTYVSSPETCAGAKAEVAMFIHESYESLEQETVAGEGEHLVAMLNLLECDANAHEEIISNIRKDFALDLSDKSFNEKVRSEKTQGFFNVINANATSCKAS